jgi:hypothetical protein
MSPYVLCVQYVLGIFCVWIICSYWPYVYFVPGFTFSPCLPYVTQFAAVTLHLIYATFVVLVDIGDFFAVGGSV